MAVHWTHLTITVSNFARTLDFYSSFCGLSLLRDRRKEGGGAIWLGPEPADGELPDFLLVVLQAEVTARIDHLGFQCESKAEVDAIAARASDLEILVHSPTDSGGAVGYWTMIRDPDGHLVEFTHGQPIKGLRTKRDVEKRSTQQVTEG